MCCIVQPILRTGGQVLKTKNNHVPFIYKGKSYAEVFTPPNEVRQKIDKLFKKWTL